jgi:hypothetical protein
LPLVLGLVGLAEVIPYFCCVLLAGYAVDHHFRRLFAVLFGGAVSMLPAFIHDIFHYGSEGLGIFRVAPAIGAMMTGLFLRLAKGFEILARSAENMIRIAMIQVTLAKCL